MAIGNYDTGTTPAVATSAVPTGEAMLQLWGALWADVQQARRELAEVMSDEELAGLGSNLTVLDEAS